MTDSCLAWLLCSVEPVPAPCYVLDMPRLRQNLAILDGVQRATGAKILLALKGFAAWSVFPEISRAGSGPLWGVCASSVDEARLGREEFGGEVHAFAAAWSEEEIKELLQLADHLVFNSMGQYRRFAPLIAEANRSIRQASPIECGLRINPEQSRGAATIYDPCNPGSRLGIRPGQMPAASSLPAGLSGLHFHALCEQDSVDLEKILEAVEKKFAPALRYPWKWLNFGGGHHITRPGYNLPLLVSLLESWHRRYNAQIYLEPGEAVALNAGWLTAEVLDIVEADMPVAILNISAACHMPDVLEMPYRPEVFYRGCAGERQIAQARKAGADIWTCRLSGKSCLAGDVIGEYSFNHQLETGEKIVFGDMAIYSMVKNTTFNGLRLPSIAVFRINPATGGNESRVIKTFGYEDFRSRLS